MDFPARTSRRVRDNTAKSVNDRIELRTHSAVWDAQAEGRAGIDRRLAHLEREWDIERCLETGASSLMALGVALGKTVDRRWYLLSAGVAAFLLQHALQGWCPPLPLFRRLGFRTADEINRERYALKLLRGDFAGLASHPVESNAMLVQEALRATKH